MAKYANNIEAGKALSDLLHAKGAELKKIYDSKDPADIKRADALKTEIGSIQNQLMALSTVGSFGQGLAKGVVNTALLPVDILKKGWDYAPAQLLFDKVSDKTLSGLVTGQPTKSTAPSEAITGQLENPSREQAFTYGLGHGIGSSWGLGPKTAVANIGAAIGDETLFNGTPLLQTALGVGLLATAGTKAGYNLIKDRQVNKLLKSLPAEDSNALKEFMIKGQSSTDPLVAGRIAELRSNPKFAEIFNALENRAKDVAIAGTRPETAAGYPKEKLGSAVYQAVDGKVKQLKENIGLSGGGAYKKAADIAGDTPMIATDTTQAKIAELIAEHKKSNLPDSENVVNYLEKLQDTLKDGYFQKKMTVPELRAWLTDFGSRAKGNEALITGVSVDSQKKIASAIFGGLKDDLSVLKNSKDVNERAVGNLLESGSKSIKSAVDKYDAFVAQGLPEVLKNKTIAAMDSETLAKTVKGLSNAQRDSLAGILENTAPEDLKRIRQIMYDDVIQKATTKLPDGTTGIDLKVLSNNFLKAGENEKQAYAFALGDKYSNFESTMKDAENFYKYQQKFAGKADNPFLSGSDLAELSSLGWLAGGYGAGKSAGLAGRLINSIKGGLTDEQTLSVLLSPETKGLLKDVITSPNSVNTLQKIEKGVGMIGGLTNAKEGMIVGGNAADTMFPTGITPAKEQLPVTPNEPQLNLEGIDLGTPTNTTPELNLEGIDLSGGGNINALSQLKFNDLSPEQQIALVRAQFGSEGNKPNNLAYQLNNPGAMIYVGGWQNEFGAQPGRTVTGPDGKTRTFAKFPDLDKGYAAQQALWRNTYGNVPLSTALGKWVDPSNQTAFNNYQTNIARAIGL